MLGCNGSGADFLLSMVCIVGSSSFDSVAESGLILNAT